MFLVFVVIAAMCIGTYKLIADFVDERQRKKTAIKNGMSFYIDRANRTVDIETGVPYRIESARLRIANGKSYYTDCVKVSALTGSLIQNYTQDKKNDNLKKREKAKEEAINSGENYYIYEERSKWPGATSLGETFEMALSNASLKIPKGRYLWCGLDDHKLYFVYTVFSFSPYVIANVLLDVEKGKLVKIVDEELYTPDEVNAIKKEMSELNSRRSSIEDWYYVGSWQNWGDKLHIRTEA